MFTVNLVLLAGANHILLRGFRCQTSVFLFTKSRLVRPKSSYNRLEKLTIVGTCIMPAFGVFSSFFAHGQINDGTCGYDIATFQVRSPSVSRALFVACSIYAPFGLALFLLCGDALLNVLYLLLFIAPLRRLQGAKASKTRVLVSRNVRVCILSICSTFSAMVRAPAFLVL